MNENPCLNQDNYVLLEHDRPIKLKDTLNDRSEAVILLWIIFVFMFCVCHAFCMSSFQSCVHHLGKS